MDNLLIALKKKEKKKVSPAGSGADSDSDISGGSVSSRASILGNVFQHGGSEFQPDMEGLSRQGAAADADQFDPESDSESGLSIPSSDSAMSREDATRSVSPQSVADEGLAQQDWPGQPGRKVPEKLNSTWYTLDSDNEKIALGADELDDLFSRGGPKIIIGGDGHRAPPFKYVKNVAALMGALKEGKLHFFAEQDDDTVQLSRGNFLPPELDIEIDSAGQGRPGNRTLLEGWEEKGTHRQMAEVTEAVTRMTETLNLERDFPKKISLLAAIFFDIGHPELATEAVEVMLDVVDTLEGKSKSGDDKLAVLIKMFNFVGGKVRDDFTNAALAKKIARVASERKEDTLLLSVGDAHLNPQYKPVHIELNKQRAAHDFPHQIIFNPSQVPEFPDF